MSTLTFSAVHPVNINITSDAVGVHIAIEDGGSSPPAEGTTWDEANKTTNVELSNGNLTASTVSGDDECTRSNRSIPTTGNTAVKVTLDYGATDAGDQPIGVGLSHVEDGIRDFQASLFCDGAAYDVVGEELEANVPITSGDPAYIYIKQDIGGGLGGGWFDNDSQTTAADREAGTNPHFTFPTGSEFVVGLPCYSPDEVTAISGTLDPTYSSGSFAAWNS